MAWLGKVTLSDFAGAVTKLSESVKNIEKNFDSALGFESRTEDREVHSSPEKTNGIEPATQSNAVHESGPNLLVGISSPSIARLVASTEPPSDAKVEETDEEPVAENDSHIKDGFPASVQLSEPHADEAVSKRNESPSRPEVECPVNSQTGLVGTLASEDEPLQQVDPGVEKANSAVGPEVAVQVGSRDVEESKGHEAQEEKKALDSPVMPTGPESKKEFEVPMELGNSVKLANGINGIGQHRDYCSGQGGELSDSGAVKGITPREGALSSPTKLVDLEISYADTDGKVNRNLQADMKMMEAALQGAANQSQLKADEISRLMIENDQLRSVLDDLKRKASDVELDALREEYQQRLGAAERKVYALTKERDMLRREQNRKSDSSILLKEKDEIIKQVMAEGEELSKKQAVQEAQMKKLRAQIRELEDEKQRLGSKLQVEEAKVESIRKDKAATEKALQESVERGQAELAAQKEYYSIALNEAKDTIALAEARADSEARADLDRSLREATEREATLVQTIDELRQALTRTEQQAAFREDNLRRDIEDLEKRCQAAEVRYEELVAHMPDSTRPLLRQIEALQESTAMRAEAWTGIERSLNSRLQQAEAKAAAAQERERAVNERLTQTLSRMAVMEAQLSCLRAEQAQLSRSLEKERQRASENRQEYLAAVEEAATQEGRARQLEEEIKSLRSKYKRDIKEEKAHREVLEQEIEQERAALAEYEKRVRAEGRAAPDKAVSAAQSQELNSAARSPSLRRWPSISSAGSVEESSFLQASLESTPDRLPGERHSFSDRPPSPSLYRPQTPSPFGKGMVPAATFEQLEAHFRQKDGELSSYSARLAALESTRDSLAEELVNVTTQCEQLRIEATSLPGMRAELEALRRRHTSALELMGERDEEVEELRADLADVKQMYREQIDMLVGQIERLSSGVGIR